MNNLYKPDGGVQANMPTLEEFCSMFMFCKVNACKLSFTVTAAPQGSYAVCAYIATKPYLNTLPIGLDVNSWENLKAYIYGNPRYCRYTILNSTYNPPVMKKLSRYYKIGNLQGNMLQFKTDLDYNQPISSTGPTDNPAKVQKLQCGVLLQDQNDIVGGGTIDYKVTVTMTFYVKFWGLRYEIS